jgi:hypothetical protein
MILMFRAATTWMNPVKDTGDSALLVKGEASSSKHELPGRYCQVGMSTTSNPYWGFRFPAEILNQAL